MNAVDQTPEQGWLEDLLFYLISKRQYDYCYVLHHVNVTATMQPFGFCDGNPIHATCMVDESGLLHILLYWPILSRISFEARLEILQHEVLHIIEGHVSSFGMSLIRQYGQFIANLAMDLVVNQKFQRKHSTAEGMPGVQLQHFPGFPPQRGSIEYAELLKKLADEGKLRIPEFSSFGKDPLAGTAGQPGDAFTGRGLKNVITGLLQIPEAKEVVVDEQVKNIIASVSEALKLHGGDAVDRFRGLFGSDHEEFMQASDRPPVIPWSRHLRVIESRNRQQVRVTSRRRPSRRHPAYFGHSWRGGLDVVFLVDTSGSMGEEELKLVDPELRGLHARGANVTVIHSDAGVAKVHEYRPSVPLERFFGRGGTDYSCAFEHIRQMSTKPRYIIGYTDGYGSIRAYRSIIEEERGQSWWKHYVDSNPDKSPDGIPTIWLLPEGCMPAEDFKEVCPWGKTIIVKRDHA